MKKRDLAIIAQALRENPTRAYRWGMALVNKRIQTKQDADKLRRVIEFKTEWRGLYNKVKK